MNNKFNDYYVLMPTGDRFVVPFLLGGLGGAAVVGLSRPRPVYVNPSYPRPPYYGPNPGPRPPYPYPTPYQSGYNFGSYGYYY